MNEKDYIKKALAIVEHKPFVRVRKCPRNKMERAVNDYLWALCQKRRITKPLYDQLHASTCNLPRFYGLAKVHKQVCRCAPLSQLSALYAVRKYLAVVLRPLVALNERS